MTFQKRVESKFITVQSELDESTDYTTRRFWLSPEGEVFSLDFGSDVRSGDDDSHAKMARKLLGSDQSAAEQLVQRGWLRATPGSGAIEIEASDWGNRTKDVLWDYLRLRADVGTRVAVWVRRRLEYRDTIGRAVVTYFNDSLGESAEVRHYSVTRRGTCRCNFDPSYQCGTGGQEIFSWEISAHIHTLDKNAFAIDNTELLRIANQYDTEEQWKTDSCEAVCNGWIVSLIERCDELGYNLLEASAKISPNQFVDVQMDWGKGDPIPYPVPVKTDTMRTLESMDLFVPHVPLRFSFPLPKIRG